MVRYERICSEFDNELERMTSRFLVCGAENVTVPQDQKAWVNVWFREEGQELSFG